MVGDLIWTFFGLLGLVSFVVCFGWLRICFVVIAVRWFGCFPLGGDLSCDTVVDFVFDCVLCCFDTWFCLRMFVCLV